MDKYTDQKIVEKLERFSQIQPDFESVKYTQENIRKYIAAEFVNDRPDVYWSQKLWIKPAVAISLCLLTIAVLFFAVEDFQFGMNPASRLSPTSFIKLNEALEKGGIEAINKQLDIEQKQRKENAKKKKPVSPVADLEEALVENEKK